METNALNGYGQSPKKLYTDAYLLFSEARLDQLTNLSSTIAVAAIGAVAFLVFALLPAISGIAKLSLYANYRMGLRPLPFTLYSLQGFIGSRTLGLVADIWALMHY